MNSKTNVSEENHDTVPEESQSRQFPPSNDKMYPSSSKSPQTQISNRQLSKSQIKTDSLVREELPCVQSMPTSLKESHSKHFDLHERFYSCHQLEPFVDGILSSEQVSQRQCYITPEETYTRCASSECEEEIVLSSVTTQSQTSLQPNLSSNEIQRSFSLTSSFKIYDDIERMISEAKLQKSKQLICVTDEGGLQTNNESEFSDIASISTEMEITKSDYSKTKLEDSKQISSLFERTYNKEVATDQVLLDSSLVDDSQNIVKEVVSKKLSHVSNNNSRTKHGSSSNAVKINNSSSKMCEESRNINNTERDKVYEPCIENNQNQANIRDTHVSNQDLGRKEIQNKGSVSSFTRGVFNGSDAGLQKHVDNSSLTALPSSRTAMKDGTDTCRNVKSKIQQFETSVDEPFEKKVVRRKTNVCSSDDVTPSNNAIEEPFDLVRAFSKVIAELENIKIGIGRDFYRDFEDCNEKKSSEINSAALNDRVNSCEKRQLEELSQEPYHKTSKDRVCQDVDSRSSLSKRVLESSTCDKVDTPSQEGIDISSLSEVNTFSTMELADVVKQVETSPPELINEMILRRYERYRSLISFYSTHKDKSSNELIQLLKEKFIDGCTRKIDGSNLNRQLSQTLRESEIQPNNESQNDDIPVLDKVAQTSKRTEENPKKTSKAVGNLSKPASVFHLDLPPTTEETKDTTTRNRPTTSVSELYHASSTTDHLSNVNESEYNLLHDSDSDDPAEIDAHQISRHQSSSSMDEHSSVSSQISGGLLVEHVESNQNQKISYLYEDSLQKLINDVLTRFSQSDDQPDVKGEPKEKNLVETGKKVNVGEIQKRNSKMPLEEPINSKHKTVSRETFKTQDIKEDYMSSGKNPFHVPEVFVCYQVKTQDSRQQKSNDDPRQDVTSRPPDAANRVLQQEDARGHRSREGDSCPCPNNDLVMRVESHERRRKSTHKAQHGGTTKAQDISKNFIKTIIEKLEILAERLSESSLERCSSGEVAVEQGPECDLNESRNKSDDQGKRRLPKESRNELKDLCTCKSEDSGGLTNETTECLGDGSSSIKKTSFVVPNQKSRLESKDETKDLSQCKTNLNSQVPNEVPHCESRKGSAKTKSISYIQRKRSSHEMLEENCVKESCSKRTCLNEDSDVEMDMQRESQSNESFDFEEEYLAEEEQSDSHFKSNQDPINPVYEENRKLPVIDEPRLRNESRIQKNSATKEINSISNDVDSVYSTEHYETAPNLDNSGRCYCETNPMLPRQSEVKELSKTPGRDRRRTSVIQSRNKDGHTRRKSTTDTRTLSSFEHENRQAKVNVKAADDLEKKNIMQPTAIESNVLMQDRRRVRSRNRSLKKHSSTPRKTSTSDKNEIKFEVKDQTNNNIKRENSSEFDPEIQDYRSMTDIERGSFSALKSDQDVNYCIGSHTSVQADNARNDSEEMLGIRMSPVRRQSQVTDMHSAGVEPGKTRRRTSVDKTSDEKQVEKSERKEVSCDVERDQLYEGIDSNVDGRNDMLTVQDIQEMAEFIAETHKKRMERLRERMPSVDKRSHSAVKARKLSLHKDKQCADDNTKEEEGRSTSKVNLKNKESLKNMENDVVKLEKSSRDVSRLRKKPCFTLKNQEYSPEDTSKVSLDDKLFSTESYTISSARREIDELKQQLRALKMEETKSAEGKLEDKPRERNRASSDMLEKDTSNVQVTFEPVEYRVNSRKQPSNAHANSEEMLDLRTSPLRRSDAHLSSVEPKTLATDKTRRRRSVVGTEDEREDEKRARNEVLRTSTVSLITANRDSSGEIEREKSERDQSTRNQFYKALDLNVDDNNDTLTVKDIQEMAEFIAETQRKRMERLRERTPAIDNSRIQAVKARKPSLQSDKKYSDDNTKRERRRSTSNFILKNKESLQNATNDKVKHKNSNRDVSSLRKKQSFTLKEETYSSDDASKVSLDDELFSTESYTISSARQDIDALKQQLHALKMDEIKSAEVKPADGRMADRESSSELLAKDSASMVTTEYVNLRLRKEEAKAKNLQHQLPKGEERSRRQVSTGRKTSVQKDKQYSGESKGKGVKNVELKESKNTSSSNYNLNNNESLKNMRNEKVKHEKSNRDISILRKHELVTLKKEEQLPEVTSKIRPDRIVTRKTYSSDVRSTPNSDDKIGISVSRDDELVSTESYTISSAKRDIDELKQQLRALMMEETKSLVVTPGDQRTNIQECYQASSGMLDKDSSSVVTIEPLHSDLGKEEMEIKNWKYELSKEDKTHLKKERNSDKRNVKEPLPKTSEREKETDIKQRDALFSKELADETEQELCLKRPQSSDEVLVNNHTSQQKYFRRSSPICVEVRVKIPERATVDKSTSIKRFGDYAESEQCATSQENKESESTSTMSVNRMEENTSEKKLFEGEELSSRNQIQEAHELANEVSFILPATKQKSATVKTTVKSAPSLSKSSPNNEVGVTIAVDGKVLGPAELENPRVEELVRELTKCVIEIQDDLIMGGEEVGMKDKVVVANIKKVSNESGNKSAVEPKSSVEIDLECVTDEGSLRVSMEGIRKADSTYLEGPLKESKRSSDLQHQNPEDIDSTIDLLNTCMKRVRSVKENVDDDKEFANGFHMRREKEPRQSESNERIVQESKTRRELEASRSKIAADHLDSKSGSKMRLERRSQLSTPNVRTETSSDKLTESEKLHSDDRYKVSTTQSQKIRGEERTQKHASKSSIRRSHSKGAKDEVSARKSNENEKVHFRSSPRSSETLKLPKSSNNHSADRINKPESTPSIRRSSSKSAEINSNGRPLSSEKTRPLRSSTKHSDNRIQEDLNQPRMKRSSTHEVARDKVSAIKSNKSEKLYADDRPRTSEQTKTLKSSNARSEDRMQKDLNQPMMKRRNQDVYRDELSARKPNEGGQSHSDVRSRTSEIPKSVKPSSVRSEDRMREDASRPVIKKSVHKASEEEPRSKDPISITIRSSSIAISNKNSGAGKITSKRTSGSESLKNTEQKLPLHNKSDNKTHQKIDVSHSEQRVIKGGVEKSSSRRISNSRSKPLAVDESNASLNRKPEESERTQSKGKDAINTKGNNLSSLGNSRSNVDVASSTATAKKSSNTCSCTTSESKDGIAITIEGKSISITSKGSDVLRKASATSVDSDKTIRADKSTNKSIDRGSTRKSSISSMNARSDSQLAESSETSVKATKAFKGYRSSIIGRKGSKASGGSTKSKTSSQLPKKTPAHIQCKRCGCDPCACDRCGCSGGKAALRESQALEPHFVVKSSPCLCGETKNEPDLLVGGLNTCACTDVSGSGSGASINFHEEPSYIVMCTCPMYDSTLDVGLLTSEDETNESYIRITESFIYGGDKTGYIDVEKEKFRSYSDAKESKLGTVVTTELEPNMETKLENQLESSDSQSKLVSKSNDKRDNTQDLSDECYSSTKPEKRDRDEPNASPRRSTIDKPGSNSQFDDSKILGSDDNRDPPKRERSERKSHRSSSSRKPSSVNKRRSNSQPDDSKMLGLDDNCSDLRKRDRSESKSHRSSSSRKPSSVNKPGSNIQLDDSKISGLDDNRSDLRKRDRSERKSHRSSSTGSRKPSTVNKPGSNIQLDDSKISGLDDNRSDLRKRDRSESKSRRRSSSRKRSLIIKPGSNSHLCDSKMIDSDDNNSDLRKRERSERKSHRSSSSRKPSSVNKPGSNSQLDDSKILGSDDNNSDRRTRDTSESKSHRSRNSRKLSSVNKSGSNSQLNESKMLDLDDNNSDRRTRDKSKSKSHRSSRSRKSSLVNKSGKGKSDSLLIKENESKHDTLKNDSSETNVKLIEGSLVNDNPKRHSPSKVEDLSGGKLVSRKRHHSTPSKQRPDYNLEEKSNEVPKKLDSAAAEPEIRKQLVHKRRSDSTKRPRSISKNNSDQLIEDKSNHEVPKKLNFAPAEPEIRKQLVHKQRSDSTKSLRSIPKNSSDGLLEHRSRQSSLKEYNSKSSHEANDHVEPEAKHNSNKRIGNNHRVRTNSILTEQRIMHGTVKRCDSKAEHEIINLPNEVPSKLSSRKITDPKSKLRSTSPLRNSQDLKQKVSKTVRVTDKGTEQEQINNASQKSHISKHRDETTLDPSKRKLGHTTKKESLNANDPKANVSSRSALEQSKSCRPSSSQKQGTRTELGAGNKVEVRRVIVASTNDPKSERDTKTKQSSVSLISYVKSKLISSRKCE